MIDVNTPNSLGGILLALFVVFVAISAIITSGLWAPAIAAVVGGVTVYVVYKILVGFDRRFTRIFSGGAK